MSSDTTHEGTIKFFNNEKKYGFILSEDNKEIFFHISGVKTECKAAMDSSVKDKECTYQLVDGQKGKGREAKNIQVFY